MNSCMINKYLILFYQHNLTYFLSNSIYWKLKNSKDWNKSPYILFKYIFFSTQHRRWSVLTKQSGNISKHCVYLQKQNNLGISKLCYYLIVQVSIFLRTARRWSARNAQEYLNSASIYNLGISWDNASTFQNNKNNTQSRKLTKAFLTLWIRRKYRHREYRHGEYSSW